MKAVRLVDAILSAEGRQSGEITVASNAALCGFGP
jgi:hypothetical protein